MPIIVVTAEDQGAGKTGVAAAIARHYAFQGRPVTLARLADDSPRSNAGRDAGYFGSLFFAPGSATAPLALEDIRDPGDAILVVEAPLPAAAIPGAKIVAVSRSVPAGAPLLALSPAALVITRAPGVAGVSTVAAEGKPPVISIGEDRTLNGFTAREAQALLHADVLVQGDDDGATCDHLVVSPIASDAGQPYFRRFASKAVVARFDKTDMHLAAMQSDPAFLILTGGRRPSDYLFDAASAKGITVLLSRTDTENTVIALERIYERTSFSGERKLERMAELLAGSGLYEAIR